MLRMAFVPMCVVLFASQAWGANNCSSNILPQQIAAVNAKGQVELTGTVMKMVYEQYTVNVPHQVPYTVTENGQPTTKYKTEMTVEKKTRAKTVMALATRSEDLQKVKAQTVEGQTVAAAELTRRLAQPTAVLVFQEGEMLPDYYRPVFKPGTLVLVLPMAAMPVPVPAAPGAVPAPAAPPSARRANEVPTRFAAQETVKVPTSPPPNLEFASLSEQNKTLNLRRVTESTFEVKMLWSRGGDRGPETIEVPMSRREFHTSTNSFAANLAEVTTADGKKLPIGELPQWLRAETLVVVAADDRPVDRYWLQTIKGNVLVLRAPSGGHGSYGVPAMAPAAMPVPVPAAPPPPPGAGPAPVPQTEA